MENNKLQELTQKLYNDGLEKGRSEAERLVAEAKEQAAKILADARAEADAIMKSTGAAVKAATMDAAFVKDMLLAVAQNWNANTADVSLKALLPEEKRAELDAAMQKSAAELLKAGVEVGYSKDVKTGFKLGEKSGGYYISFTDESFDALLKEYLREKVSNMLYK